MAEKDRASKLLGLSAMYSETEKEGVILILETSSGMMKTGPFNRKQSPANKEDEKDSSCRKDEKRKQNQLEY